MRSKDLWKPTIVGAGFFSLGLPDLFNEEGITLRGGVLMAIGLFIPIRAYIKYGWVPPSCNVCGSDDVTQHGLGLGPRCRDHEKP